ncbi:uncharacterized protein LOC119404835 [Rhipicephalus sanguineus]|uniref:Uncharacterized protein n=1 Tax=Rhipicephalus sanguineus TaxID=34632 RepID=A0A9D4PCN6_RHISA|nr:uncharacterized protein LOC119404835 [Rhipicephalus sanguineus]KAH7935286.1 hypothetical protein HPB52_005711 [Rhipicephalus sanguineus]
MLLVRSICTVLRQIKREKTIVNSSVIDPAKWMLCLRFAHVNRGTNSENTSSNSKRKAHFDSALSHESCDATLDSQVLQLLSALRLADALALTVKSFAADHRRYPSSKTATALISALARAGDVEGLRKMRDVVDILYPNVSADALRFEHYDAEALSRSGRAAEAILKFETLFLSHKGHRTKICSLLTFLAAYLVNNDMVEDVALLARMCERLADRGYFHPLTNVWKVFFLSERRRYHATASELVEAARLRPRAKPFFQKKVNSVISHAVDRCDVDMVQRLLNVVLYLGMPECCGLVLSFLLEFYCDADNLKSAQKTFEHSEAYGIELNPVTFYRYTCFLSSRGIQIPHDMLLKKYKMDPKNAKDTARQNNVKFKF